MAEGKDAHGWAARDASGHLSPYHFSRRVQRDDDVTIKVLFCGLCHTDLHVIKNEFGNAMYPVVPGHEVVGVVTDVGRGVTKFKPGDTVGVGYFVDSCRACDSCGKGTSYCPQLMPTSNGVGLEARTELRGGQTGSWPPCSGCTLQVYMSLHLRRCLDDGGATTQGGFSDVLVVRVHYVVWVPSSLPPAGAAPLLCAGVTVFSPLVQYALNAPGKHLGVVGLGVRVQVWQGVRDEGHRDEAEMVVVGFPSKPLEVPAFGLVTGGKRVAGSAGGGVGECQAMLDFAGEHGITADVEVVGMDYVNTAIQRLERNDVRYGFVVDVAGSKLGVAA
ncbi:unnamed protein product [Miscanthus lutarioriparius]|uniref:cinnamyl-alcohol dehydrogenase n=1 Tax=Miscanthus lutarioriparius TaxID=422564 RepID=A0A811NNR3_9POAL|nr:unnamed protein product [Miscanthus lutarioriparius]